MTAALGLALASACASSNQPETDAEPVPPTYVRIDNQAFLDMTIYAYRSSQRVRLGIATGNSRTKLMIPAGLVFMGTPLRFQADPIGSSRRSVSEEILVNPGDEVVMVIPPQ